MFSHKRMAELHAEYGPIVQLNPTTIAVSDQHEIRRIMVTEDWHKDSRVYTNFRQNKERPTLVNFTNKKDYSHRKRLLSSGFGTRSIRAMQPRMRSCIDVLVQKLEGICREELSSEGHIIDISRCIRSLAVDIIGATTFGSSFDVVKNGSHPLPKEIEKGLKLSGILQFAPLLNKIPYIAKRKPYIDQFTRNIIRDRQIALEKHEEHDDLLQKMVACVDDSEGSRFNTSDLQDEVVVFLLAGSETTGSAEIFMTMMLVNHPDKYTKLREEIDAFYPAKDAEIDVEHYSKMRYLQACVNETMRLYPAMASGSPREVLQETEILGYRIPQGTTVFPTTTVVHRDGNIWDEPDQFIPERWLEKEGMLEAKDLPYYPFSAGSRVCIGKHFAIQEIHLTMVNLLRRFIFEKVPGQDESTVLRIALQLRAGQYMVRVKERD